MGFYDLGWGFRGWNSQSYGGCMWAVGMGGEDRLFDWVGKLENDKGKAVVEAVRWREWGRSFEGAKRVVFSSMEGVVYI